MIKNIDIMIIGLKQAVYCVMHSEMYAKTTLIVES